MPPLLDTLLVVVCVFVALGFFVHGFRSRRGARNGKGSGCASGNCSGQPKPQPKRPDHP